MQLGNESHLSNMGVYIYIHVSCFIAIYNNRAIAMYDVICKLRIIAYVTKVIIGETWKSCFDSRRQDKSNQKEA